MNSKQCPYVKFRKIDKIRLINVEDGKITNKLLLIFEKIKIKVLFTPSIALVRNCRILG